MVNKVDGDLASLGVCYSHQMYDQTKLHVKNAKGTKDSSLGFISNRRCLFCNINKTFYSRGEQCDQHSWTLVGRGLQVPCGGQYHCTSLTEIPLILYPNLSNKKSRYVCTSCYEKHGGHIHQRSGTKGKTKSSPHRRKSPSALSKIPPARSMPGSNALKTTAALDKAGCSGPRCLPPRTHPARR